MPTRSVGSAKGGGGSHTDGRDSISNWCFGYQYGARTGTGGWGWGPEVEARRELECQECLTVPQGRVKDTPTHISQTSRVSEGK